MMMTRLRIQRSAIGISITCRTEEGAERFRSSHRVRMSLDRGHRCIYSAGLRCASNPALHRMTATRRLLIKASAVRPAQTRTSLYIDLSPPTCAIWRPVQHSFLCIFEP